MNDIRIMSHAQFEAYAREPGVPPFAAIAICSSGGSVPYVAEAPRMAGILYEQFDDVDDGEVGAMSPQQASEIASFTCSHEPNDVDLVVSCHYGESRSAAVAAAVMAHLGRDEMAVWTDPAKAPNMHCYVLVCQALGVERNEGQLRELFLANVRAGRST